MNQFLDILLLASFVIGGVYSLWTAVQMRRWKELKPNKFIYPNGCEPGDCTNPEGFRAFMRPQVLLAGLEEQVAAASADYQELSHLLEEKEREDAVLSNLMEQWESAADLLG